MVGDQAEAEAKTKAKVKANQTKLYVLKEQ